MDYCLKYLYNRNKQGVNKKTLYYIKKYRYFMVQALNLKGLKELYKITKDERIVRFINEVKKVNSNPKFRKYITEEQDKEFILNSVRSEGEVIGLNKGKYEIARNLLRENINTNIISSTTGLSIN